MADVAGLLSPATDVVNRGIASLLGAPVDGIAGVLSLLGYDEEKPVGGSEWIGGKMERFGMVTPTRRPLVENLVGALLPIGGAINTAKAPLSSYRLGQQAVSENVRNIAINPAEFSDFTFLMSPHQQEMLVARQMARKGDLPDRFSVLVSKTNDAMHPMESRVSKDQMTKQQLADLFDAVYDGRNQIGIDANPNNFFLVNTGKDFGKGRKGVGLFEIRDGEINPLTAYPASKEKVATILQAPKKGK